MKAFIPYCITANSTTLWQVSSLGVDPRLEKIVQGGASIEATFAGVGKTTPMLSVESPDIATMLGICGTQGVAVDPSIAIYFAQLEHGARIMSGANHVKLTIAEGIIIPRQIRAPGAPGEASMSIDALATYDGTNLPLVKAINQSLPTSPPAPNKFCAGPLKWSGGTVNVQDWTIDFGHEEVSFGVNGLPYDSMAAIRGTKPVISANTLNMDLVDTITTLGLAVDDLYIYLRALTNRGKAHADSDSSHIKFTVSESLATIGSMDGSEGSEATLPIEFQAIWDRTNDIMTHATGQVIA